MAHSHATFAGPMKEPSATARSARPSAGPKAARPIYTPEERQRRDATVWTLVQGILAPAQFLVFAVSLVLVLYALVTGEGYAAAAVSIVIKTMFLYVIMVTGAIWEKVVFGQYLFAPSFYWEDVVSFAVIALHTAYLVVLFAGVFSPTTQLLIALAAYAAYVVNAAQFLMKMKLAKRAERAVAEGAA